MFLWNDIIAAYSSKFIEAVDECIYYQSNNSRKTEPAKSYTLPSYSLESILKTLPKMSCLNDAKLSLVAAWERASGMAIGSIGALTEEICRDAVISMWRLFADFASSMKLNCQCDATNLLTHGPPIDEKATDEMVESFIEQLTEDPDQPPLIEQVRSICGTLLQSYVDKIPSLDVPSVHSHHDRDHAKIVFDQMIALKQSLRWNMETDMKSNLAVIEAKLQEWQQPGMEALKYMLHGALDAAVNTLHGQFQTLRSFVLLYYMISKDMGPPPS